MAFVWNLLRVRSAFDLDIATASGEVARRLRSRVLTVRPIGISGKQGYAGEITERGFALRRFGSAAPSRGESRPVVDIRGEFQPKQEGTCVAVVIRHGRLLVTFALLLIFLGLLGLAVPSEAKNRNTGRSSSSNGAALIGFFGALFYLGLWWDVRRVRKEVVALLTDETIQVMLPQELPSPKT